MSPTFLHLKWIVSIFLNEQLSRDPCFAMCMIHVHVCVYTSHGVTRIQKPAPNRFGQLLRGEGGIKQNVRD